MVNQEFKIYKLHFTTPIHIGDARDDYSVSLQTIASDTMYSALVSSLAKIGNDFSSTGDLGCTISSLFPFYQKDRDDKDAVLFLPKPLKLSFPDIKETSKLKKIKKVSWLDIASFQNIINGKQIFDGNLNNINGAFLSEAVIDKDFIVSQVTPRVKIESRIGQEDAVPFYMDKITFKGYSGMYFIAQGDTTLLEKALNLLQYEGIGTDRNVGNGFFEYEPGTIELSIPDNSDYIMSLSSFVPESKEQLMELLDSDMVAYDFQRRGGWITSYPHNSLRKNAIYMFLYGSVFKKHTNGVCVLGLQDIDLKPDIDFEPKIEHPIWRCGRSIFIPIKLQ